MLMSPLYYSLLSFAHKLSADSLQKDDPNHPQVATVGESQVYASLHRKHQFEVATIQDLPTVATCRIQDGFYTVALAVCVLGCDCETRTSRMTPTPEIRCGSHTLGA